MINFLDLESMSNVFRLIAVVFLSEYQTEKFRESYNQLLKLIEERPLVINQVKRIMKKAKPENESSSETSESSNESSVNKQHVNKTE